MADSSSTLTANFSLLTDYTNTVASLNALASRLNANLRFNYLGYFYGSFMVNLLAGRIPADSQPDSPPASYVVVGQLDDPTKVQVADMAKLDVAQTGGPVCPVPAFERPKFVLSGAWF